MTRRNPTFPMLAALAAWPLLSACDGKDTAGPAGGTLVILTDSLPHAVQFEAYAAGVDAEGGSGGYFWSIVAGALPPGIESTVEDLSDDDLTITGTAETAGAFDVTFRVTSGDGQSATRSYTLVVRPPPTAVTVENLALPPTVVGQPYDVPLAAAGGDGSDAVWSLVAGSLPPGIQLLPSGRLRGTPTATGTFTVTLRATSGAFSGEATFTLRVIPDQPTGYQITAYPVTSVPAAIQPHLEAALARWAAVVTTDLGGGPIASDFFDPSGCGGFGEAANGASVDDLLLLVNIDSIDGPGKVLGQAGPCGLRGNGIPFVGILTLDEADLMPLVGTTTLTAIITHEIGHVMGIGSLWERAGLVEGLGTADPRYTGAAGVAAYQAVGGLSNRVPVENQGGEGTVESHWRESVFNTELMTGFSEAVGVPQPLSRVTVASLMDLGYAVDLSAADPYTVPFPLLRSDASRPDLGHDIVLDGPLRVAPWGNEPTPHPREGH